MSVLDEAIDDLHALLADGRVELGAVLDTMSDRGHPRSRTEAAKRELDVRMIREGPVGSKQRFWWELPTACPVCHRPWRADPVPSAAYKPWDDLDVDEPEDEDSSDVEPESPPPVARSRAPKWPLGDPHVGTCSRCGAASFLVGRRCSRPTSIGVCGGYIS